jgi:hypothetical protein
MQLTNQLNCILIFPPEKNVIEDDLFFTWHMDDGHKTIFDILWTLG